MADTSTEFPPPLAQAKDFCVSIVGLCSSDPSNNTLQNNSGSSSSPESQQEKTESTGVGKSWLGTRFILSSADKFSQALKENSFKTTVTAAEFSRKPEIYGSHAPYLGSILKRVPQSDAPVCFHVVEHTAFTDASGSVHRPIDPFVSRVTSPVYACSGRRPCLQEVDIDLSTRLSKCGAQVDVGGYLLIFDPTKDAEKAVLQLNVLKAVLHQVPVDKPVAIAVTKCDLVTKNEFRWIDQMLGSMGASSVFWCSASKGIGCESPFLYLHAASMGDTAYIQSCSYAMQEEARHRAEEDSLWQVLDFLKHHVTASNATWSSVVRLLEQLDDADDIKAWAMLRHFHGLDFCERIVDIRRVHVAAERALEMFNNAVGSLKDLGAQKVDDTSSGKQ